MGRLASKPSTASVALVWEDAMYTTRQKQSCGLPGVQRPGTLLKFEEEIKGLRWQQKFGLKSNRVNRVIWHRTGRYFWRNETAVIADLPLIVANYSELEQPAKNLFLGEVLVRAPTPL